MSMVAVAAAAAGGLVVGGIGLIGSYISSEAAKDAAATQSTAATTAATTQVGAAQAAISEQQKQFEAMRQILSPYVQTGVDSMAQQRALTGLDGPEAQRSAMEQISNSPEMFGLIQQGENAMLQQGAATGGLRGGNTQAALAQFRPQMLSSLINQQYGRLSGLTQIGQASAAGVGASGMGVGSNIGNLLMQQGQASAQGTLQTGQANAGAQLAAGQAYSQIPGYFLQGGMMGLGMAPAASVPATKAYSPWLGSPTNTGNQSGGTTDMEF